MMLRRWAACEYFLSGAYPRMYFDSIYNIGKSDRNILMNIMKTAQDSYTITIKQIVRFQERMHLEKFHLKMVAYRPFFISTGLISGKPC